MSNVLSIANAAPLPQSGKAGGQMSHTYGYDALYRLTSASGTYRGADSKSASYTLAMSYDNMHRIKSKSQHLTQQGVQFDGTLNAGYDLTYTYQDSLGHKFQLSKVEDLNYRTEGTPKEKIDNGHRYLYDANGNLVYINTSRVKKDGKEDEQAVEKKYRWDEENRLLASDENGFVANYWYDADGERTVKSSGEGEQIYVNSEFSAGVTNTAKFSLYVSPYLVASQGGKYTKHIYIGSQRIVSKLGDLASYGADPRRIPYAGTEADGVSVDYQTKYNRQQKAIKDNYADFGVPYNGEDNNDYVNGEGFCCNDGTPTVARAKAARSIDGNFKPNDDYEKMQFYYHPDHLGSSSYITNLDGEVVQHIEYVPFGEVFIEERNNTWNTPYLFNAKEYDEETGMYYYGARYYEPRISLWMSVDPEEMRFPHINTYTFSANNPIKFIDTDGNSARVIKNVENKTITIIAHFVFFGEASSKTLATQIASDIQSKWNEPHATVSIGGAQYKVNFVITGEHKETGLLLAIDKFVNMDPANNYVEIRNNVESGPIKGASHMTLNGNEGVFKKSQVEKPGSTTEAHEFGHSIGLWPGTKEGHPEGNLIGKGQPGIMYPRGSRVDAPYSYNGQKGGVLNPEKRKVLQSDIDMLRLDKLKYDKNGEAQLGESTSGIF